MGKRATGGEVNWLVEIVSKTELGERGRECSDREVGIVPKRQTTESGRINECLIELISKREVGEGEREVC